jgi:hypothetical protein
MTEPIPHPDVTILADRRHAIDPVREKLTDAMTPGYQAEFDPIEAERAGAFMEDALSEADALESQLDRVDATAPNATVSAEPLEG